MFIALAGSDATCYVFARIEPSNTSIDSGFPYDSSSSSRHWILPLTCSVSSASIIAVQCHA
jgi:hypothetical protein